MDINHRKTNTDRIYKRMLEKPKQSKTIPGKQPIRKLKVREGIQEDIPGPHCKVLPRLAIYPTEYRQNAPVGLEEFAVRFLGLEWGTLLSSSEA